MLVLELINFSQKFLSYANGYDIVDANYTAIPVVLFVREFFKDAIKDQLFVCTDVKNLSKYVFAFTI